MMEPGFVVPTLDVVRLVDFQSGSLSARRVLATVPPERVSVWRTGPGRRRPALVLSSELREDQVGDGGRWAADGDEDGQRGLFAEGSSFADTGLSPTVCEKLSRLGFHTPTKVQADLVPELLEGKRDVVVAAETGSGKTLGYLLPVINNYLERKRREPDSKVKRFVDELELGILASILAGDRHTVPPGTVIVISTPRAFVDRAVLFEYSNLRSLVIDEADMLLEGSFRDDVGTILNKFRRPITSRRRRELWKEGAVNVLSHPKPGEPQLIFVGATYPTWVGDKVRSVTRWIKRRYPDIVDIRTDWIHRCSPQLRELWLEVEVDSASRLPELVEAIESGPPGQVMVFCNTAKTVVAVASFLNTIPSLEGQVIACHKANIAARGIDLGAGITHVIQYEFGQNVVHYLHRIGRTARAGSNGQATHFFDQKNDFLATEIRAADRGLLEAVFSRNRNLANKRKKAKQKVDAVKTERVARFNAQTMQNPGDGTDDEDLDADFWDEEEEGEDDR